MIICWHEKHNRISEILSFLDIDPDRWFKWTDFISDAFELNINSNISRVLENKQYRFAAPKNWATKMFYMCFACDKCQITQSFSFEALNETWSDIIEAIIRLGWKLEFRHSTYLIQSSICPKCTKRNPKTQTQLQS